MSVTEKNICWACHHTYVGTPGPSGKCPTCERMAPDPPLDLMAPRPSSESSKDQGRPFQLRVVDWMMETFSMEVCRDTTERNHRFLEEALELVQAMGCTQAEAHMLVGYVYGRPVGEPEQEVGGALVTLAALCAAADFSMADLGNRELERCWLNIDRIRAKQAGKPKHSPLPGPAPETKTPLDSGEEQRPTSAILRRIAGDLTDIAANPPMEMDSAALARLSGQLLAVAGQVSLGEKIDPRRSDVKAGANLKCPWCGGPHIGTDCTAEKANAETR